MWLGRSSGPACDLGFWGSIWLGSVVDTPTAPISHEAIYLSLYDRFGSR